MKSILYYKSIDVDNEVIIIKLLPIIISWLIVNMRNMRVVNVEINNERDKVILKWKHNENGLPSSSDSWSLSTSIALRCLFLGRGVVAEFVGVARYEGVASDVGVAVVRGDCPESNL